jgi:hypothetical protein
MGDRLAAVCFGVVIYGGVEPIQPDASGQRWRFRADREMDRAAGGDSRPASSQRPAARVVWCDREDRGSSRHARIGRRRRRGLQRSRDRSRRRAARRGRAGPAAGGRAAPPAMLPGRDQAGGQQAPARSAAQLRIGPRTVGRAATEHRRRRVDPRRYEGGARSLPARSAAPARFRQMVVQEGEAESQGSGPRDRREAAQWL